MIAGFKIISGVEWGLDKNSKTPKVCSEFKSQNLKKIAPQTSAVTNFYHATYQKEKKTESINLVMIKK